MSYLDRFIMFTRHFCKTRCSDPKGGSCIPWNPTSPREARENVFIRNDLPLMCRGIFPYCCVLWGKAKPWGAWAPKWTIFTQLRRSHYRYCSDPKGGSCIPWNPTSPKEAHGDVLIRNDLLLMCRSFFPHCCVL